MCQKRTRCPFSSAPRVLTGAGVVSSNYRDAPGPNADCLLCCAGAARDRARAHVDGGFYRRLAGMRPRIQRGAPFFAPHQRLPPNCALASRPEVALMPPMSFAQTPHPARVCRAAGASGRGRVPAVRARRDGGNLTARGPVAGHLAPRSPATPRRYRRIPGSASMKTAANTRVCRRCPGSRSLDRATRPGTHSHRADQRWRDRDLHAGEQHRGTCASPSRTSKRRGSTPWARARGRSPPAARAHAPHPRTVKTATKMPPEFLFPT